MRRFLDGTWMLPTPFQDKEGEGGGGGGGGSSQVDIEATVRKLLSEKGEQQAVAELLKDNFKQREEIRDLQTELKGAAVPEGGLVLDADQATAWKKYQELGKPEDLEKDLQTKQELEEKDQKRERQKRIAEAADASSYEEGVLGRLLDDESIKDFEVREETVDGEKAKVAYIIPAAEGQAPRKLTEHAEEHWKEFLPALEAEPEAGGTPPDDTRRTIRQSSRGRAQKHGAADVDEVKNDKSRRRRYSSL